MPQIVFLPTIFDKDAFMVYLQVCDCVCVCMGGQRVEEESLVKNSSACKDYLIEAMKYHLLPDEQRSMMKTVRTRVRTPVSYPKVSTWSVGTGVGAACLVLQVWIKAKKNCVCSARPVGTAP